MGMLTLHRNAGEVDSQAWLTDMFHDISIFLVNPKFDDEQPGNGESSCSLFESVPMFGFRQTHVELHKLLGQRPKVEIVAGNPWVFALNG